MKFSGNNFRTALYAAVLCLWLCGCSAPDYLRNGNAVTFSACGEDFTVEVMADDAVMVLCRPSGTEIVTRRLLVADTLPRTGLCRVRSSHEELVVSTRKIEVVFNKTGNCFSFLDRATGRKLLSEPAQGARTFTPQRVGSEDCLGVVQRFEAVPGEGLYGLGQYQQGAMDYSRDTVRMVQANMDIASPLLVSTGGWGLLWDNYSATTFIGGEEQMSFDSEVADASAYYFLSGGDMDGTVAAYRRLTGRVPMLPLSAFGFWQSKERYKSFDELTAVAAEYRRRGVPLDNMVQDWEYWGPKERWNALCFDTTNFPDAAAHIARLHDSLNVRYTISVWPGFGPETEVYAALDSIGALFDESTWAGYKIFDVFNPAARDVFWRYLREGLYDKGVDGWWLDATEPSLGEGFAQATQERKLKRVGQTAWGDISRYLNVYSLVMCRDFYDRLRAADSVRRTVILTRSAFAGQQACGTILWSGDVSASWQVMRNQIAAGVNLSMAGHPWWCSDIGGFSIKERGGQFPGGLEDEEYKELYTRWFQMVAFNPIFRAHGTDVPREIWRFGEPGTPYYDAQVEAIRLRYRLIPWFYSLAWGVHSRDEAMMRGLAMDFPHDTVARGVATQYMMGRQMMVCPVTVPRHASHEPGITPSDSIAVWLPGGAVWYDFHTGEPLEGGRYAVRPAPIDRIPLFVRGGSIIPMGAVRQYVSQSGPDELEIRIYGGADARFELYEDAGDGYGYQRGEYALTPIRWDDRARRLTIGPAGGKMGVPQRTVNLVYCTPRGELHEKTAVWAGEKITVDL